MNESLSPEELKQLIAGYVLGDLSPEEAEQVRSILRSQPELTAEIQVLQEILALIPYSLPQTELPPQLRSKILATAASPAFSPRNRSLPWQKIMTAVAASIAILVAVDNYYLRQELRLAQERKEPGLVAFLQQPQTQIYQLAGTQDASQASARIIYNPNQEKAILIANQLPEVKAEQIYRLWAIVGQEKIACADFRTDTSGNLVSEFALPQTDCSKAQATLAVTLESFPAPNQPKGSIVLLEKS
jgi:anti-sigma-K factor RskA